MSLTSGAREGRTDAIRALAIIRLAALPVVFVGERIVQAPDEASGAFAAAFAATALYALGAFALAYSPRRASVAPPVYIGLDLFFVSALALASGGETSEVRGAFFLPPVVAAFLLGPAWTAATSAAATAAYVAVSFLAPPVGELASWRFVVVQAGYIAWLGFAATILSTWRSRRERQVDDLARGRGRLVAQAIDAEEQARGRLAEALHEEAVQDLLAARLDLAEARQGSVEALERIEEEIDRSLTQLRETVAELHPVALRHGGLAGALSAIASRSERRGGFRCSVRVDPAATGLCDELLLSLAREFLANAAKHARATRVSIVLERRADELCLEVADDGCGMPPGRAEDALAEGHIGLASSAERVKALTGSFEVASTQGAGTVVRVQLPVVACELTTQHGAESAHA